jgi:drug/metabolite transporter (DMT)-like permease
VSQRLKVLIAFLTVYLVWGSTYLAIRVGVRDLPPALLAGTRFLIAGALVLAFARLRGHPIPKDPRRLWPLAIVGFLLLVGGNGLVVYAEQFVDSGLTAVIVATSPFLMAGAEALLPDGERIGRRALAGLLVGFAGLVLLVSPNLVGQHRGDFRGFGALLVACVSWTIGTVYSRRRGVPVPALVATGIEMLAGGIFLCAIALVAGDFGRARWTATALLAQGYLIVFGAAAAFTAYIWLLDHVPPSRVSTYAYVNPVVALVLGWVILDETLTGRILVSAAVILIGVILVTTARARSG